MSQRQYFSIFVTGSFSSGKTSFIEAVSHQTGSILQPDRLNTAQPVITCGRINLDDENTILLYEIRDSFRQGFGLPGVPLGYIVLVNSAVPETFREARSHIAVIFHFNPLPVVVAANPHPLHPRFVPVETWSPDELRIALELAQDIPVIECNTREREPVKQALIALLETSLSQPPDEALSPTAKVDYSNPFNAEPPVILERDTFFSSEITHHYVAVVSTLWILNAHRFMLSLANRFVWLSPDDNSVPRYHGYYEIDSTCYLHIMPYEQFGFPAEPIQFMLEQWVASIEGKPEKDPAVEDKLDLSGAIGCMVLFDSADKHSIRRVQHFIRAVGDMPCVLADVRSPAADSQEEIAPLNRHIVKIYDTYHRITANQVMRELCQFLTPEISSVLLPAFSQ